MSNWAQLFVDTFTRCSLGLFQQEEKEVTEKAHVMPAPA